MTDKNTRLNFSNIKISISHEEYDFKDFLQTFDHLMNM